MANICLYKIKVKGRQRACYALVDMMPLYSWEKEYVSAEGTEDDFELIFLGACKWGVDCYTTPLKNPVPFTDEELNAVQDGDHWGVRMQDKSVLLDCEIWCNSKDIDDCSWAIFEHYNRGEVINDECPKELHIKRGRDYDNYGEVVMNFAPTTDKIGRKCKVKFESGSYCYSGDFEVGDIVYSDGAMSGNLGRVVAVEDNVNIHGYYEIKSKVGHADPFIEEEIEEIWKSYKPKERKEYIAKFGLDEKTTKKKFISVMDYKWTKFAIKENDWNKFVEAVKDADWNLAKL